MRLLGAAWWGQLGCVSMVVQLLTYASAQVSGTVMLYPPSRLYCFICGFARRVMVMAACAGGAAAGSAAAATPATPASSQDLRPIQEHTAEELWRCCTGDGWHMSGTVVQGLAAAGLPLLLLLHPLPASDAPAWYTLLLSRHLPAALWAVCWCQVPDTVCFIVPG